MVALVTFCAKLVQWILTYSLLEELLNVESHQEQLPSSIKALSLRSSHIGGCLSMMNLLARQLNLLMSNFYLDYPACMNAAGRVASRGTIARGPSTHRYDNIWDSMSSVIIPLFSLLSKFMSVTSAASKLHQMSGITMLATSPQFAVFCALLFHASIFICLLRYWFLVQILSKQHCVCYYKYFSIFNSIVHIPCSLRISSFGT